MKAIAVVTITTTIILEMINKIKISFEITVMIIIMIITKIKMKKLINTMKM